VLSGEYEIATSAGTRASDSGFHPCDCDAAYDDSGGDARRYCRMYSIAWASDLRMLREALPGFCPSWERMHIKFTNDVYTRVQDTHELRPVATVVDKGDTVLVGGGLHFDHLTKEAAHKIYNRFPGERGAYLPAFASCRQCHQALPQVETRFVGSCQGLASYQRVQCARARSDLWRRKGVRGRLVFADTLDYVH